MDVSLNSPSSSCRSLDLHNGAILTPSGKIKALLAQFDDSDSDRSSPAKRPPAAKLQAQSAQASDSNDDSINNALSLPSAGDMKSEGVVPPQGPSGRFAARMQAATSTDRHELSDADEYPSVGPYARIKHQLKRTSTHDVSSGNVSDNESSEDDLQQTTQRERTLVAKRPSAAAGHLPQGSQSPSPTERPQTDLSSRRPDQAVADPEDLPHDSSERKDSKFLALVEKHRKGRLAREAAEEIKRADRLAQLKKVGSSRSASEVVTVPDRWSDESSMSDSNVGHRMTQPARSARKASKKALEEMSRETQRMSRSMQLAHQTRTRKKITKESLLARFNFTNQVSVAQSAKAHPISNVTSSAPTSDADGAKEEKTPPTSPLPIESRCCKTMEEMVPCKGGITPATVNCVEFSAFEGVSASQPTALVKGKCKAVAADVDLESDQLTTRKHNPQPRRIRVQWPKQDSMLRPEVESESDLEILKIDSEDKKLVTFDKLSERTAREPSSHLILRSLAHVQSGRTASRQSIMTAAQMDAHLKRTARLQAHQEKEEKLQKLRLKGVSIATDEERLKEQQEVEDLVEQERLKNVEIQRREKDLAKKDGTYVRDQLLDDEEDEDADFEDEGDIEDHSCGSVDDEGGDEESDIEEDSDIDEGSDREEYGESDDGKVEELLDRDNEGCQAKDENGFGDQRLQEQEEDEIAGGAQNTSKSQTLRPWQAVRSRRPMVISDEEDEEDGNEKGDLQHSSPSRESKTPQSVVRSARKMIPGLQMSDDLPIGLTQAFAATMADSGTEVGGGIVREQDSVTVSHELPSPGFDAAPRLERLESLEVITDSQPATQTQSTGLDLSYMPSQRVLQSPAGMSSTQISFIPTQDVGCVLSPFKENRFDILSQEPHSTIDTAPLPQDESSPQLKRRSRLIRGRKSSHSDNGDGANDHVKRKKGGPSEVAFVITSGRATKANHQAAFNKSTSNAKDAVEDAAEESEDEYAGLGGVSDDEEGEENDADREMIDRNEELGEDDEGRLAGFYADRERKQDEAAVSKLYKDITTGALRRKRGAAEDLDLSDEEDANGRRREAKRREFARMRRELLKDEAVGKIADDEKKQAFLKSIEDRDDVEDDDIEVYAEAETEESTQSQSQPLHTANQPCTVYSNNQAQNKPPLGPAAADIVNRSAPQFYRTQEEAAACHRKPSNLAEVRKQISFLIEEPESQSTAPDAAPSDDEESLREAYVDLDRHLQNIDNENDGKDEGLANFVVNENDHNPQNSKDTGLGFRKPQLPLVRAPAKERRTKANVVDRLSLLRQMSSSSSSASISTTGGSSTKLAFSALSATSAATAMAAAAKPPSSASTFKLPKPLLLRRSTTNSSLTSDSGVSVNATASTTSAKASTVTMTTERGAVEDEKEMIRKAQGGKRSTVNYYAKDRVEERERARRDRGVGGGGGGGGGGIGKGAASLVAARKMGKANSGAKKGFLGGLFGSGAWE